MKNSVILPMVALACLLSSHATAQTKDGTLSGCSQRTICQLVGDANKEPLDIYLGILRDSRSEGFVSLKESYSLITCMGRFTMIQWATLNGKNRFIGILVKDYKVPKNSINRNGESELDGLDRLDRTEGKGDGRSNYGVTAKYLRKKIAKDKN